MVFGKKNVHNAEAEVEDVIVNLSDNENEDATPEPECTNATRSKANQAANDDDKPLWQEVEIAGATGSKNAGGSKVWVCKHCHQQFTSSYTRIHQHFFGAQVGRKAEIKRCQALLKDRVKYESLLNKVKAVEKVGVSKSLKNSVINKKQSSTSNSKKSLEESFGVMERNIVDMKIMKGLCANGIPFNVLRNPHFQEMITAINRAPAGYKAPSYDKARTVLLDECVRDVEKELTSGVSIVSDGWSNVKHRPLINVIAVNSRGAMFMYAEDFSDNAANCKAAGREVEKVHKHIFWSPCCVHTLNLIFKDLASEFFWLMNTYRRGKVIVKYFLNHTHALAIFRDNSKLELLKVAKTRFASHYILLKRLWDCRDSLATTIVLNSWREWVKNGDENTRQTGILVVDTIKSEEFWDDVESILAFTKPIYLMIKFCDGEGSKMGEIYEKMDNMLGEIKDVMVNHRYAEYYSRVENIILARWEKMTIPLHCLGFALSPRFYDKNYLEEMAPGGVRRKAPNFDKEVMSGVMRSFKRIAESDEEARVLREQFATFHMKKGLYSMPAAHMDAVTMDAIDWWSNYGSETPELAEVAKKVLSQPISSSSAERNWSTYAYIHNVKRNRLNSKRADKLVFIHSNIRLQSRFSKSYTTGPHKKWDVNPEKHLLGRVKYKT
ncbi:hypothetical protein OSB04_031488 [Centaurea solstitialis]|uniref:HAT C-terminal dimerisation domain-containing protein n=1 Tax=Centaurea solstitialis TaxID=347529 RepID=A0AA38S9K8_9ASTR|nr:hypothetical protein OSB04_031488 [Centaurea solstitialis]